MSKITDIIRENMMILQRLITILKNHNTDSHELDVEKFVDCLESVSESQSVIYGLVRRQDGAFNSPTPLHDAATTISPPFSKSPFSKPLDELNSAPTEIHAQPRDFNHEAHRAKLGELECMFADISMLCEGLDVLDGTNKMYRFTVSGALGVMARVADMGYCLLSEMKREYTDTYKLSYKDYSKWTPLYSIDMIKVKDD